VNGQSLSSLLVLVGFLIFFWLVIIRPQTRERRRWEQMIAGLKRGQAVVTRGGIHGVITDMRDNLVRLRVAENVEITLSKSAIAEVEKGKVETIAGGGRKTSGRKKEETNG